MYHIKTSKIGRHVFVTIYLCDFLKRIGDVEHIGEAGRAEFKLFKPEEIAKLPMPEFYKSAINRAFQEK